MGRGDHYSIGAQPGQRISSRAEIVAGECHHLETGPGGDLAHPRRAGVLHRKDPGAASSKGPERDAEAVPRAGADLQARGCGADRAGSSQVTGQRRAQFSPRRLAARMSPQPFPGLRPRSRARARLEGSGSPVRSRPARIASRTACCSAAPSPRPRRSRGMRKSSPELVQESSPVLVLGTRPLCALASDACGPPVSKQSGTATAGART